MPCGVVYFEWWFIRITPCVLQLIVLGMARVVAFIFVISLLTMTTTSSYLTHAIEILLAPLQRLGVPTHEVALANMIALRFIPTLAEETERIMKAQASRGATVAERRWWRPGPHDPGAAPAVGAPLRQRPAPGRGTGVGHGGPLLYRRQRAHQVRPVSQPAPGLARRLAALGVFLGAWLIPWPAVSSLTAGLGTLIPACQTS